jgi:hypothetical protein
MVESTYARDQLVDRRQKLASVNAAIRATTDTSTRAKTFIATRSTRTITEKTDPRRERSVMRSNVCRGSQYSAKALLVKYDTVDYAAA